MLSSKIFGKTVAKTPTLIVFVVKLEICFPRNLNVLLYDRLGLYLSRRISDINLMIFSSPKKMVFALENNNSNRPAFLLFCITRKVVKAEVCY